MSTPGRKKMSEEGEIFYRTEGTIAWITLSRPSALNSLTWEMYQHLENVLKKVETDASVRVLVLRGDGEKAFAAGTDIRQFQGFTAEAGVEYEHRIDHIIGLLERLSIPTIAAVHGYAVGGGLMLATACDLCYSTEDATFGAPMAKTLGNCLSYANYQRLASAIGVRRVKELLYTARLITAKEAMELNLVTEVLPREHFFEQVQAVAERIASHAPLTIWATKQAYLSLNLSPPPVVSNEAEPSEVGLEEFGGLTAGADSRFEAVIKKVYGSRDFAEGVRAHIEKRPANWEGS